MSDRDGKVPSLFIPVLAGIIFATVTIYLLPSSWLATPLLQNHHAHHQQATAERQEFWACPMFCTRLDAPGTCPVCGMVLERFVDTGAQIGLDAKTRNALSLSTEEVNYRYLAKEIRTVGMFHPDETAEETVSAWVDGRIDRLYGGYTGTPVEAGQPLLDLYSPDLYVAQKELILAKHYLSAVEPDSPQYTSRKEMLDLARDKVGLLGLPPALVSEIEGWDAPKDALTIESHSNGVVLERYAQEGAYVKEGQPLLKIADLHHLWLMLDIHEKDIFWLALGQKVLIEVSAQPGKQIYGKIGFIYPTLNPKTRTVQVRVEVDNEELALRPGMFGTATILARLSEDGSVSCPALKGEYACPTHPLERGHESDKRCAQCGMNLTHSEIVAGKKPGRVLAVPRQAVLSTGSRHLVYVQWWVKRDQSGATLRDEEGNPIQLEKPEYQGFEVVLGTPAGEWKKASGGRMENRGDYLPVISGLPPGVHVVTHAQFLIDSQMELTGKPSLLQSKGGASADPHAQHRKQQEG